MLLEIVAKWLGLLGESLAPAIPGLITSFFSVLVGALPFMVIAAFASATLEVFVSRDTIARMIPKNPILGILVAPVIGLAIPMCECGIVPVARRMIQKGIPGAAAITFMLANPIINPLSIYSTYLAFSNLNMPINMVWWRIGLGYFVAIAIGILMQTQLKRSQNDLILHESYSVPAAATMEGAQVDTCGCGDEHHAHDHHHAATGGEKVQDWLHHAATEFFDVAKYFIIGSGLAAISQALINRDTLAAIGGGMIVSVLVMMAFAYLVSICSEADAFVAAGYASTFMPGGLLAFLVAGPMTDVKNTMMMLSAFRRPFVIFLNIAIFGLVGLSAIALNFALR
jgi:uncharacterized membrane protein YraQ (UPF0718 family)